MYPTETIVDIREIIFSDKEKEKTKLPNSFCIEISQIMAATITTIVSVYNSILGVIFITSLFSSLFYVLL